MMKKNKSTRSQLKRQLDTAWSQFIHARDKVCQKCGGTSGLSAHHLVKRSNLALRWEEDNGLLLCFTCHIHQAHENSLMFAEWLRNTLGKKFVENLTERANQLVKWSLQDLEDKLAELRRKKEEIDGTNN